MDLTVTRERLDAAVERIQAALDPEEILLFGSQARGDARADSDADLLLVLPPAAEAVPCAERQRLAWNAVRGDPLLPGLEADVFAYTVAEMRRRLAAGDTVIRDALAEGTALYPSRGSHSRYAGLAREWSRVDTVKAWLQYAEEDLEEAEGARFPRTVAYHAQQAAEKALKALTFHLGGEPARAHDLTQLLLDIASLDTALGRRLLLTHQNAAAGLTKFAVTPRHPGADVSLQQAQDAVVAAQAIVNAVREAICGHP